MGLTAVDLMLPAQIVCLKCLQPTLQVYPTTNSDCWHRCLHCHWQGDSAELFCQARGIVPGDLQEAIVKRNLLSASQARKYLINRNHREHRRKTVTAFFRRSTHKTLLARSCLARLLQKTHNTVPLDNQEWTETAGTFCGAMSSSALRMTGPENPVLLLPAESAPGRLEGLLTYRFGPRAAEQTAEKGFISAIPGWVHARKRKLQPVGFLGLTAALDSPLAVANNLLVLHDPVRLLRCQLRYLRATRTTAPVLSTVYEPSMGICTGADDWRSLSGKSLIHWATSWTPHLLASVAIAGGKLFLTATRSARERGVATTGLSEFFARLDALAFDWRLVLEPWASTLTDKQLLDFWKQALALGMPAHTAFGLTPYLLQRITRLTSADSSSISVGQLNDTWQVIERNHQWYARKRGKEILVLDGVLRVELISAHVEPKRGKLAHCVFLHRGREYRFRCPLHWIQNGNLRWLQRVTDTYKLDFVFLQHGWENQIWKIGKIFRPPTVTNLHRKTHTASIQPRSPAQAVSALSRGDKLCKEALAILSRGDKVIDK